MKLYRGKNLIEKIRINTLNIFKKNVQDDQVLCNRTILIEC